MPLQALMSTPTGERNLIVLFRVHVFVTHSERVVFALLEFVDASAREVAVLLDKTTLGAMTIRCAPVDEVEVSFMTLQASVSLFSFSVWCISDLRELCANANCWWIASCTSPCPTSKCMIDILTLDLPLLTWYLSAVPAAEPGTSLHLCWLDGMLWMLCHNFF